MIDQKPKTKLLLDALGYLILILVAIRYIPQTVSAIIHPDIGTIFSGIVVLIIVVACADTIRRGWRIGHSRILAVAVTAMATVLVMFVIAAVLLFVAVGIDTYVH